MCGIISYKGKKSALDIVISGLKRLEYRGYDSWGILISDGNDVYLKKQVGKISQFQNQEKIDGHLGVGHTRWATHGGVTETNAHPHFDCQKNIFVVHNGIIENYQALKEKLTHKGHKFVSETDTETIPHLIEEFLKEGLDYQSAVFETIKNLRGTFALVIFNKNFPQTLIGVRFASPLVFTHKNKEFLIASDPSAISLINKEFVALNDGEIVIIEDDEYQIKNFDGKTQKQKTYQIDWAEAETKIKEETFMLKEIKEIPFALENTLRGRIIEEKGRVKLGGLENFKERILKAKNITLTGCGTAFYACLYGEYLLEEIAQVRARAILASELKYKNYPFSEDEILIAISQSGETIDTLEAVKLAKNKNVLTIGIVNVPGSSIAREVDCGIHTYAGPEYAVASTKAFISQMSALVLFSLFLEKSSYSLNKKILKELKNLPKKISEILQQEENYKNLASKYLYFKNFLYLGRKFNYISALEGALKLKEIAYVHSESYPGGEMKHGPIALIDENFPSVVIAPQDSVYEKMISNLEEIKARKGKIILVSDKEYEKADDLILISTTEEIFYPFLSVPPLYLFAYYFAKFLNREIDRPRNLAKSVTVE